MRSKISIDYVIVAMQEFEGNQAAAEWFSASKQRRHKKQSGYLAKAPSFRALHATVLI